MRRTGRTSRIVDFAVDQIINVGQCIVTDHISFEFEKVGYENLKYFIDSVTKQIEIKSSGTLSCTYDIERIKKIPVVHFKRNALNTISEFEWIEIS